MKNKLIVFIAVAAFAGGIIGSLVTAPFARANFLQDLYNQYVKPFTSGQQGQSVNKIQGNNFQNPISMPQIVPEKPYAPTIDYEQAVIGAVEKASPAVVSVIISKEVPVIEQCPYDPFSDLPPDMQQLFGQGLQFSQPCQKGIQKQDVGGGSGFIITSDGMILTNKHVAEDPNADYTVFTNDGKKYAAKVLARSSTQDLAVLKINAGNLPVLVLGDSDSVKLGQTAIAIGNALGEFRNTVSTGVISGLSRTITASGGGASETIEGVLQTDAAINPGNSGGPLLNLKGEVVGINTAVVSGAQSIGFAIPINQAKKAIESIKRTGKIITPYLGVRYILITSDLAQKENLPVDKGALVRGNQDGPAVVKDSPADKAGIKAEDIITGINGGTIDLDHSLSSLIAKYNVGDTLKAKILRNGSYVTLNVTLEERPKNL